MNNETAGKTCPQKKKRRKKKKKKEEKETLEKPVLRRRIKGEKKKKRTEKKKRISINYANLCLFRSKQKTAHQKVVKAAKSPNVAMPEMDGNKLCNNSVVQNMINDIRLFKSVCFMLFV